MYLSIISPVYHAEVVLENLVSEIQKVMNIINMDYEIILVDDRSPDQSWKIMQQLSSKFAHVKVYD